jgi:hypothetical protein
MATQTNMTTSYAGEFAGKYIAAAILSANTIESNLITVKPNIKYREVLKNIAVNDIVKNGGCDFDPTSTVTLTERSLQPESLKVNLQLCKADFRSDWEAVSMGYSATDVMPKNFADFLIAHVAAKVAAKMETTIWSGVNANQGEFDGFETLLAADAALPSAQEIAGTTVAASTILVELRKIINAIPDRLYGYEGFAIYCSQAIFKAYIQSLGGFGTSGLGGNGVNAMGSMWYTDGSVSVDGVPLVMCKGMTSTVAIATYKDNLYFGTGLLNDHQAVKVIDMEDIDGSENVRFIMKFTGAVNYGNVTDIVTYGITNSAN